jgi:hypothetical protein
VEVASVVESMARAEPIDLVALVSEVVRDSGKLLSQQMELLRVELGEQLGRAGSGAVSVAIGGGLAAAAGLMSGLALAHWLHETTRLPLWSCYGVVAGTLGVSAAVALRTGQSRLAQVQILPPPQTAQAIEENLTWLQDPLAPGAS